MKEDLKERRRQVFSHRCCGLSIRGIAEVMDLSKTQVQKDLNWAYKEWGDQPDNTREAIQAELVEVLRRAVALTMADAERQSREGVSITTTDGEGNVIQRQTKKQIDPRTVAELGRTAQRFARMIGVDAGIDGGGPTAAVQVVLPAPADPSAFMAAAEPVNVTAEADEVQLEASESISPQ
ncbi:hypothetical protein [Synechococcus sp. BIOS-E4-1]|uniref:hypothetical protein n=1 Tax=Synechococcus sp. BIOS-E4-1 TaxID=1400864 RepID=UPI00164743E1|nr:hypothetical protein [Synechococcus sp. BIOS-E4-1]